jgi:hypothetical protein
MVVGDWGGEVWRGVLMLLADQPVKAISVGKAGSLFMYRPLLNLFWSFDRDVERWYDVGFGIVLDRRTEALLERKI